MKIFYSVLFLIFAAKSFCAENIVYHDRAEMQQQPYLYLRAINAVRGFDISSEKAFEGQTSIRLNLLLKEDMRFGTIMWDLSPMKFTKLRVRVYVPENMPDADLGMTVIFGHGGAKASIMKPYFDGKTDDSKKLNLRHEAGKATSLPKGKWITYEVSLPEDLAKKSQPPHRRDEDVAPNTQRAVKGSVCKAVFLEFEAPAGSPAIGKDFIIFVDLLELIQE